MTQISAHEAFHENIMGRGGGLVVSVVGSQMRGLGFDSNYIFSRNLLFLSCLVLVHLENISKMLLEYP